MKYRFFLSVLLIFGTVLLFGIIGCSSNSESPVLPTHQALGTDSGDPDGSDPGDPYLPDPSIDAMYFDVDFTRHFQNGLIQLWDTGLVRIREPWSDPDGSYLDPDKAQVYIHANNHDKTFVIIADKYNFSWLIGTIYYGVKVTQWGNDGFSIKKTETVRLWVRPGNNDDTGICCTRIISGRYLREIETWNSGTPPGNKTYSRWACRINGTQVFDNSDPGSDG